MNPSPDWEFLGAVPDGEPFQIGGLDVWKHKWKDTSERVHVKDPHHHQDFTFDVYEISGEGKTITFAAGEFSNCIWGFYIKRVSEG